MKKFPASPSLEEIGIACLTYLSQHEEVMGRLAQLSGLSSTDLVATLRSSDSVEFLIDFFLQEETLLLDFCEQQNLTPETIWKTYQTSKNCR